MQTEPAEVRLHVSARTQDEATARAVADEVETLYTNGPAGGGGVRKYVEEVFSVCSIFVPREDVHAEVKYMVTDQEKGRCIMKLREIAHSRTGDKGEISNISLIPYDENDYELLKEKVTAEKVKAYFSEICHGEVIRYELDGLKAFNFVLDKTLGGGVTRSLAIDRHGKALGMALLEMEI